MVSLTVKILVTMGLIKRLTVAGRVAHVVYMVLCLVNNIFACANMLLGASAAISAL